MEEFMKELSEMNLEQVIERMTQMETEIRSAENKEALEGYAEKIEAIKERRVELEDLAKRQKLAEELQNGAQPDKVIESRKGDKTMEIEVRNTKEYINAFAEYIKTNDDKECRALLSENGGGTVAVPAIVSDIVKTAWDKEGIMSLVKKSFIAGNLKVGFERSATGAVIHTEGTAAPDEETLVLGTVTLVPQSIKKWITISDEALDLRGEAFLQYVYNEVAYQIAKKAADSLVAQIVAGTTAGSATAVPVAEITESSIALGTVANAIAALSDEATNPVIIMNKATYAAFKAVQYAGNYAVDPFEGLQVVFNNSLPAFGAATSGNTYAIVGDLYQGALANFPNGQEIKFIFDDKSLAEADLVKIVGREYVALGVVGPKSFCKIKK